MCANYKAVSETAEPVCFNCWLPLCLYFGDWADWVIWMSWVYALVAQFMGSGLQLAAEPICFLLFSSTSICFWVQCVICLGWIEFTYEWHIWAELDCSSSSSCRTGLYQLLSSPRQTSVSSRPAGQGWTAPLGLEGKRWSSFEGGAFLLSRSIFSEGMKTESVVRGMRNLFLWRQTALVPSFNPCQSWGHWHWALQCIGFLTRLQPISWRHAVQWEMNG